MLKVFGAAIIGAGGFMMGAWALWHHWQRRPLSDGFYRLAMAVHGIIGLQVALGVILLVLGYRVPWMHVFYGTVGLAGALAINRLRPKTNAGRQYRTRPLVHATLGLLILLVALRAWMVA